MISIVEFFNQNNTNMKKAFKGNTSPKLYANVTDSGSIEDVDHSSKKSKEIKNNTYNLNNKQFKPFRTGKNKTYNL